MKTGPRFRLWHWLIVIVVVYFLVAALQHAAPNSGFVESLHSGFTPLSQASAWIAQGFTKLSNMLNGL